MPDPNPPPAVPAKAWLLPAGILALYAAALALLLPEHEPWTDEAQAWLLARDAPVGDLLFRYLRYEGTPGLWHLLLCGPAKAGWPYYTLSLVGACAALGGVALLLFRSPFPWWLRAVLPFTYFLAYQYAVVARSYCLMAMLLFAACVLRRDREQHYGRFALALALLAHVSLHTALLAGAFWGCEILELWRRRNSLPRPAQRKRLALLAALALNFGFIIWQLLPPPDLFIRPPVGDLRVAGWLMGLALNEAATSVAWLSAVVWLGVVPLLVQRRVLLLFLGGMGGVLALMGFRYIAYWHTGILTLFLLTVVWIALDQPEGSGWRLRWLPGPWAPRLALGALAILAVVQVRDTVKTAAKDFADPYSGSAGAAEYLRKLGIDRRTINALDIHSFAVLPYFERNFFANYRDRLPGSFWIWSRPNESRYSLDGLKEGRPEYLLICTKPRVRSFMTSIAIPDYEVERVFPGEILWKGRMLESDQFILYRRASPPVEAAPLVPP